VAAKPFSKAIEHGIFAALVRVINPDNQASNLIAGKRIACLRAGKPKLSPLQAGGRGRFRLADGKASWPRK